MSVVLPGVLMPADPEAGQAQHVYRLFTRAGAGKERCVTAEACRELSDDEVNRLHWLCSETFRPDDTGARSTLDGTAVEIGPRLNFDSPFCSNAVAICHAMGLDAITRVEASRRRIAVARSDLRPDDAGPGDMDPMTEAVWSDPILGFARPAAPEPVRSIPLLSGGRAALSAANRTLGLGMDDWDLDFYYHLFAAQLTRDPTDVELFQLGQSNSEHSRHWFFKGVQEIDGARQQHTLFQIVQQPLRALGQSNSIVAFHDNGGVIAGHLVDTLAPIAPDRPTPLRVVRRTRHIVCTAETHNHPTMISPFPGAATGTGGMLRDLSAVGRGSVAGISAAGYLVGRLFPSSPVVPGEAGGDDGPSGHATPLAVLVEGSNGVSAYGNEVGIPTVLGFTRSFGQIVDGQRIEARKPVLYCAGLGEIDATHVEKQRPEEGMLIVAVGGPAYPIGIGGGGASSMAKGENAEELDFKSVQRGNAEMENRTLRAIRACVELGELNPVASIHDQGAGGPGNVIPELVEPAGGRVDIRKIRVGANGMSVLEIWSGEYQERFALLVRPTALGLLQAICERERAPCEVLGEVDGSGRIVVEDSGDGSRPVDLDLRRVLTGMPQKTFSSSRIVRRLPKLRIASGLDLGQAIAKVFALPQVGSKGFLVHKADRSVTGLVARQQCCGPLGLAVADVGVRAAGFLGTEGAAFAIGEQPIKMLIDPAAGARMAIGEMVTNLCSAPLRSLSDVKCRANWMWNAKLPGEAARLYDAALAVRDLMLELGIAIDGGKDSLSMSATIGDQLIKSPGELVILGYAPVVDINSVQTPDLKAPGRSRVGLVDLGFGRNRLGGSSLAQAFGQIGDETPDVDEPRLLAQGFAAIQHMIREGLILSLHDRSDGGLAAATIEMAMAGNSGLHVRLPPGEPTAILFAEELGFVLEYLPEVEPAIVALCMAHDIRFQVIGETSADRVMSISQGPKELLRAPLATLIGQWTATSSRLEEEQTELACAHSERAVICRAETPSYHLTFTPRATAAGLLARKGKPKVAVLREEGSNSDREMAAACHAAGLEPWDVAMSDLLAGKASLDQFRAVLFSGGFSFMDVFGSAKGWAAAIRFNERLRAMFGAFYARPDTLSLGSCNGAQLMALLSWVPQLGTPEKSQPRFLANASGRFESRWNQVLVQPSPSVHLAGMEGSRLGIWSEHGEGRLFYPDPHLEGIVVPLAYVDASGKPTETYPWNPNGSPAGACALSSPDGRHLALMPHPERSFLPWQWEWMPPEWKRFGVSPWLRLFQNMRAWLDAARA